MQTRNISRRMFLTSALARATSSSMGTLPWEVIRRSRSVRVAAQPEIAGGLGQELVLEEPLVILEGRDDLGELGLEAVLGGGAAASAGASVL